MMANKISHDELFGLIDGDYYTGLGGPFDYTAHISGRPSLEDIEQWAKVPTALRHCKFEIGYGELCAQTPESDLKDRKVIAAYDSRNKEWYFI
jgi:hypothetical protein